MKKHYVFIYPLLFFLSGCISGIRTEKPVEQPGSKIIILSPEKKSKPYVINGERYYPLSNADGFVETGIASWYGKDFHGRPTANGEIFDMFGESAAHKTLPLGTYVSVTNLDDNSQITLRINDRGPFVQGRIIDLSYAAAKKINMVQSGLANVKVTALGKEIGEYDSPLGISPVVELQDPRKGEFSVQVGAFGNKDNAVKLGDRLKVIFDYVDISVFSDKNKKNLYRVRVSKSQSLAQADKIEKKLKSLGFDEAFIVSN